MELCLLRRQKRPSSLVDRGMAVSPKHAFASRDKQENEKEVKVESSRKKRRSSKEKEEFGKQCK